MQTSGPVESFIKQLSFISGNSVVLLEGDLILCEDFKKEIDKL